MRKNKEPEYEKLNEDILIDDDDIIDDVVDFDSDDNELLMDQLERPHRTWRDTERYREMRELYKVINDELYTGFLGEEFLEDE